jgi:hypothetical protein
MFYGLRMTVVLLVGGAGATYVVEVGAGAGAVVVLTHPAKLMNASDSRT